MKTNWYAYKINWTVWLNMVIVYLLVLVNDNTEE